jgi:hypothetical protein
VVPSGQTETPGGGTFYQGDPMFIVRRHCHVALQRRSKVQVGLHDGKSGPSGDRHRILIMPVPSPLSVI